MPNCAEVRAEKTAAACFGRAAAVNRRTAAVMFANHHVPYEIVAKILGHGNVSTTAEFYARILDSSVIEAMKKAGLDSPAI